MDDHLIELRRIRSILLIANADTIVDRLATLMTHRPSRSIIELLAGGDMRTEQLEVAARAQGVARSTMYKALADLERIGVVDRPRRGTVALTDVAAAFASGAGSARRNSSPSTDDGAT